MISSVLVVENMEMVHDYFRYSGLSFFHFCSSRTKKILSKLFSFIVDGKTVPQWERFCLGGI